VFRNASPSMLFLLLIVVIAVRHENGG